MANQQQVKPSGNAVRAAHGATAGQLGLMLPEGRTLVKIGNALEASDFNDALDVWTVLITLAGGLAGLANGIAALSDRLTAMNVDRRVMSPELSGSDDLLNSAMRLRVAAKRFADLYANQIEQAQRDAAPIQFPTAPRARKAA